MRCFLHYTLSCCPVVYNGNQHKARSEQILLLFPLNLSFPVTFAYKIKRRKSHRILNLFCHNAFSKSHKYRFTGLVCADPSRPPTPLPHCSSSIQDVIFGAIQLPLVPQSVRPFKFIFSERLSFSHLDSRRMPWGRKFWQGTLHPYYNLEHSNLWIRLIEQKSVKVIGTFFGDKIYHASPCCLNYKEVLHTAKCNFPFRFKNRHGCCDTYI